MPYIVNNKMYQNTGIFRKYKKNTAFLSFSIDFVIKIRALIDFEFKSVKLTRICLPLYLNLSKMGRKAYISAADKGNKLNIDRMKIECQGERMKWDLFLRRYVEIMQENSKAFNHLRKERI